METENEDIDGEVVEVVEGVDLDNASEENNEELELDEHGEPKKPPESEEGEVTVTIEGEEPEGELEAAPGWVKELRKKNRDNQKTIKALEARLEEKDTPAKTALGEKPTLEGCDFDTEKFESDLGSWHERKRQADSEVEQAGKVKEQQQTAWNESLESYGTKKAELKVADYDESEAVAQEHLDVTQQGIIVQGADNPALVIYALGRNEKKAKELAAIKDPVKFTFAVAKLETQLKVSGKKAAPAPEKKIKSGTANSSAVDSALERLRTEAAKTGDYSKVIAYKRNKKQA